jgi:hypothetical protein
MITSLIIMVTSSSITVASSIVAVGPSIITVASSIIAVGPSIIMVTSLITVASSIMVASSIIMVSSIPTVFPLAWLPCRSRVERVLAMPEGLGGLCELLVGGSMTGFLPVLFQDVMGLVMKYQQSGQLRSRSILTRIPLFDSSSSSSSSSIRGRFLERMACRAAVGELGRSSCLARRLGKRSSSVSEGSMVTRQTQDHVMLMNIPWSRVLRIVNVNSS